MSALSDALAAMDKLHFDEEFQQSLGPANAWEAIDISKLSALTWIEKALPWLEIRAEILRTLLILARAEKDAAYDELIADASEELAALDALLAEAKGEGK